MIYYILPARKGSKGFPYKNRLLFDYTVCVIPPVLRQNIIVTTDDEEIIKEANGLRIIKRPDELSNDTASMKDVLIHAAHNMNDDDTIVMLYLTYPERTWDEIKNAIGIFEKNGCKSLLCKKDVKTHPYLCIDESGKQIIKHDLYRRQDYPKIYEISHYIFICKVSELAKLNKNLYNDETYFHFIKDKVDIDCKEDFYEYCSRHSAGR